MEARYPITYTKSESEEKMDETEAYRRQRVQELNIGLTRAQLENVYGEVLDMYELEKKYEVLGFMAPFVIVKRVVDGVRGVFEFQHSPRFYFNWKPA